METVYSTTIMAKDLKALAQVAKALNDDVTLSFSTERGVEPFRFWSTDEQKKCALVGLMDYDSESAGNAVRIRIPTKSLYDVANAFGKDSDLMLRIEEGEKDDPLTMRFTEVTTGEVRTITVQEADEEDQPYAGKVGKTGPTCIVPTQQFTKIAGVYARQSDVVDLKMGGESLALSYTTRRTKDSWTHSTPVTGSGAAKYDSALLSAAATAAKVAGKEVKLTMSPKGTLRLSVANDVMACRIYVVASQAV
jgi:hypothetical protein